MQRLSLGGRGVPAQLLDPTKDPLHMAHFRHAKVLQQRKQTTWIPGKEGSGERLYKWLPPSFLDLICGVFLSWFFFFFFQIQMRKMTNR